MDWGGVKSAFDLRMIIFAPYFEYRSLAES
jgi:hypothetical protein